VMQAIGYAEMIQAGSAVMAYATQNGDLSVMADTYQNPYGRPVSSPMPAYWGIAALTGGGMPGGPRLFPHYKDQACTTTSSSAETKVYCFNNEAGGYNILLVNRREAVGRKVGVTPSALPAGTWLWRVHQTNPNTPFDPPTSSTWYDIPAGGQLDIAMPKTSWAVIELKLDTAAPPPVTTVPTAPVSVTTTSTGQTATIGWQPPASDGGQPVLGYIAQRNGTDANNGGPYATPTPPGAGSLPASARQFQFTLLRPGATYTLSTRAVSQTGLGPSKSVVVTIPSGALTQPTSVTHVVAGQTATIRWQPPTNDGGRAIIGYIAQRDGIDANNGGPYATPTPPAAGSLPTSARQFQFTLLRRGSAYTLTVRAVTSAGAGPAQSVRVTIP
jgi:hypothetical protein